MFVYVCACVCERERERELFDNGSAARRKTFHTLISIPVPPTVLFQSSVISIYWFTEHKIVSDEDGIMGVGGIAGRQHNGYLPHVCMCMEKKEGIVCWGCTSLRERVCVGGCMMDWVRASMCVSMSVCVCAFICVCMFLHTSVFMSQRKSRSRENTQELWGINL